MTVNRSSMRRAIARDVATTWIGSSRFACTDEKRQPAEIFVQGWFRVYPCSLKCAREEVVIH